MRKLLVCAAPLLLLAACATQPADDLASLSDPGGSSYGLFLAGQSALNDGRGAQAAAYFEQAQAGGAEDELISERAFTAAILAGDITKAAALAPSGEGSSESGKRLGRVVEAVEAMSTNQGKAARALLAPEGMGFPHKGAAALLGPWASAMAGDATGAVVRPELRNDKVVEYFGLLGQAFLYERAKRYDEAETDFKALTGGENPGDLVLLAYGGFLERRGKRLDAIAVYDKGLADEPSNSTLLAAKARAAAGKSAPPAPTLRQGAAQALMPPAATMLAAKQEQIGLAYLRLVLRLDPNRNDAWLMVGDLMETAGDLDAAREAYAKPKPGSPEYAAGRAKLAWSYLKAKDNETALKMAREAAASGDLDSKVTLADMLRVNEQYPEAIQILTEVMAARPGDWRLLYSRGVNYDRAGRPKEGEADLRAALKIRPDDSEMLNYLGYTWIDRGEHLSEALGMVQRAAASNPKSGAIIDSLGWAYYRLGDYKKAVEKLEEAIELEAGDPDINNHLGDAYWRVGRRDEAEFQWKRVLTLDPDAKMKAEVSAKLASGLGPMGPAQSPRVAGP
ncbi:tetratricopeptide repeat protein [Phenylobacterium ferrooxidans]|uniref:Tetratricopeptide repeat protein n=1 Tax=Phenylobacterium ferrooxidans TaxID=2982689 RepID=A0ABW6CXR1_9CAUL